MTNLKSLLALVALSTATLAHDFWIEPAAYRPRAGTRVDLDLAVGEDFAGERKPRAEARILSFVAFDPAGRESPVLGLEGKAPAGLWIAREPGLHVLGYQSSATPIELEAAKFEAYLAAEGLDAVVAERAKRGETAKPGREAYARCAKSFVVATGEKDEGTPAGWDRVLGHPLELVPTASPFALARDAELAFRLTFRGEPLANALVALTPKLDPRAVVRVRTDATGRATFRPKSAGAHLACAVHMTRAPEGSAHDWESQWASLTFEIPAR